MIHVSEFTRSFASLHTDACSSIFRSKQCLQRRHIVRSSLYSSFFV